jgi:hypothetical protein
MPKDWSACNVCRNEEVEQLTDYYGTPMCDDCIRIEETTDWDEFEKKKRERIAEEQEY